MDSSRLLSSVLLFAAASSAQQPAPAGETRGRDLATTWCAEEAALFAWLRDNAALVRRQPDMRSRLLPGDAPPGFLQQSHAATDSGFGEFTNTTCDESWVTYYWPASPRANLVFCVASDGRLLVADNTQRYGPESPPAADAATGRGSRGTFADILGNPGNGRDGGFWQTPQTLRPQRLHITLRDERGEPIANGRVALLPESWDSQLRPVQRLRNAALQTRALPAGATNLDSIGAGTLQGIAATGLMVCAGDEQGLVALPAEAIELDGDRMRLRLPLEALRSNRLDANESAAIATLKNISSAQAQCQASGVIDANGNGAGEYGFFVELAGRLGVRADGKGGVGETTITPPVLSAAFGNVKDGRVVRSGYVFQMFLPAADATAVAEALGGGGAGCVVDPGKAETLWCCYAWPVEAGITGNRVFFVNQSGDVLGAGNRDGACSGNKKPVDPKAAFDAASQGRPQDPAAASAKGHDGQTWGVIG